MPAGVSVPFSITLTATTSFLVADDSSICTRIWRFVSPASATMSTVSSEPWRAITRSVSVIGALRKLPRSGKR